MNDGKAPSQAQAQDRDYRGPQRAGKTTFAEEFLPLEAGSPAFINGDLIARARSPDAPEKAAIQAGKIMLSLIEEKVANRESFAIETTLSRLNYARRIPVWRGSGYHVILIFLSLPTADLAVARVKGRVQEGGHSIPEPVIRRRFNAGLRNFKSVYRGLIDGWLLFDNSVYPPHIIEQGGKLP